MDPDRWKRIRALAEQAIEASEGDRERLLADLARKDPSLHEEVEKLLRSDAGGETLLATRTPEVASPSIGENSGDQISEIWSIVVDEQIRGLTRRP